MNYDELIKKLRSYAKTEKDALNHFVPKLAMAEAADAIDELQSQLPKWIPVAEMLPEEKENVLCLCWENRVRILYFDGEVWVGFGAYIKSFVTHWMPLPELPKSDE